MAASKNLLEFIVRGRNINKIANLWEIHSLVNNSYLGQIKWFEFLRKFVFIPDYNTQYDKEGLSEISQFMEQKTKEKENG